MSPGIPKCPGILGTTQGVPTRGEYMCLGYYVVIHRYLGHLYTICLYCQFCNPAICKHNR